MVAMSSTCVPPMRRWARQFRDRSAGVTWMRLKIRQHHALCCVSTDCCHRMSTQAPSDSQQEEWLSEEDEEEDGDSALLSEPASASAAAAPQHAWIVLDRPKLQKMQVCSLRILNLLEHACTVCKSVLSSMCTIAQLRGISSGAHIATCRLAGAHGIAAHASRLQAS